MTSPQLSPETVYEVVPNRQRLTHAVKVLPELPAEIIKPIADDAQLIGYMIMGEATDFLLETPSAQPDAEAKADEVMTLLAGHGLKAVLKPFVVFPNTRPRFDAEAA